jgi:integrin alpha FG-GAP repeat containing protein 1
MTSLNQPFGVSYSGATYKYTILDTSGKRSAAQIPQLPQTSYHSLLTPYSFFGLGRTNNYIENLFVGSTRKVQKAKLQHMYTREPAHVDQEVELRGAKFLQQRVPAPVNGSTAPAPRVGEGLHYISMEGVIPNSKVVIIPPSAPGVGEWKRELYLRPGEWIPWVTITLVVSTVILGLTVWIFHWNERVSPPLTTVSAC